MLHMYLFVVFRVRFMCVCVSGRKAKQRLRLEPSGASVGIRTSQHHLLRSLLSPCDSSPGPHDGESTAMGLCTSGRSDHRTFVYGKHGASIRPSALANVPRLKP